IPIAAIGEHRIVQVGTADLLSFRTRGDPRFGLFGNVAALYGFWRPEPQLPKDVISFWPLLALLILAVVAVGLLTARRSAAARLLPIAYSPTFPNGLSGQLRTAHYPSSWSEADTLMGKGPEDILFLPWHQYLAFPFTQRVVANPAAAAFRRHVVIGDNLELP